MAISKAKAKARAKKAAATRKRNAAKKSPAKKRSPAKRKSSHKKAAAKHHGKTVSSPTYDGRKFKCAGKKVRVGKKRTKVARVFCRRAEKK